MSDSTRRVGLLGLGVVGTHYRDHLLRAYPDLLVFDQDEDALGRARAAGAQAARDLADLAANSQVIVASLPNPSADRLVEVFEHTDAKCYMMTDYMLPRIHRGDMSPGFSVKLQLKDHRLAADLGHAAGVPLPINAEATRLWEVMGGEGLGDRDITSAHTFARRKAGVDGDDVDSRDGSA